jgi:hypothetical protein
MIRIAKILLITTAAGSLANAFPAVMDFSPLPSPTGAGQSVPSVYTENDLRVSSTYSGASSLDFDMRGPTSPYWSGVKALTPRIHSAGVVIRLNTVSGRRFHLKSLRLHPSVSGSVNVSFMGYPVSGGSPVFYYDSTGSSMSGRIVQFPASFSNLSRVEWINSSQGTTAHQFSQIVAEFPPHLDCPTQTVVTEGQGMVNVPITLSAPHDEPVDIVWTIQTATSSATTPSDFTLPGAAAAGTVTLPAGSTSASVSIPIIADTAAEPAEEIHLTWGNPTPGMVFNGNFSSKNTVIRIADDDGVVSYGDWMTAHGLPGAEPSADPNNDGISNIECWLHKLNPAGENPPAWLARRQTLTGVAGNDPGLMLTLPTPLPNDVRIVFSESTDLATFTPLVQRSGFGTSTAWSGSAAVRVIETNTFFNRTITLRASVPAGPRPNLFLRASYQLISGGGNVE